MTEPRNPSQAQKDEIRIGWRMAGTGFQVASEVAAGVLLGWIFDRWRGHGNIGVIVGSIVGIAVALWSLIRNSLKLNRELDSHRKKTGYPEALQDSDQSDKTQDDDWDDWDKNEDDWDNNTHKHDKR